MSNELTKFDAPSYNPGDFDTSNDPSSFNISDLWTGAKNLLSGSSSLGTAGQIAGLYGISSLLGGNSSSSPAGYKYGIPTYTANRQMLPIPANTLANPAVSNAGVTPRRPGSGGITYFSPMQYTQQGAAPALSSASNPNTELYTLLSNVSKETQAPTVAPTPAPGTTTAVTVAPTTTVTVAPTQAPTQAPTTAVTVAPVGSQVSQGYAKAVAPGGVGLTQYYKSIKEYLNTYPTPQQLMEDMAKYGISQADIDVAKNYAEGGSVRMASGGISNLGAYSDGGQLLRGPGDGVSDDIPATIGGKQEARLADGEFVLPARIVSEIGNGSSEAGSRKLYAMMDRIKQARSATNNIAADTNVDKYLPT